MKRYSWVVMTNCVPGSDARYEEWYDKIHIPDLLRVPGIVAAKRGRVCDVQTLMVNGALQLSHSAESHHRYLAIYSIESDDPEGVLKEVIRRANTPEMFISADMLEAHTILYEDV